MLNELEPILFFIRKLASTVYRRNFVFHMCYTVGSQYPRMLCSKFKCLKKEKMPKRGCYLFVVKLLNFQACTAVLSIERLTSGLHRGSFFLPGSHQIASAVCQIHGSWTQGFHSLTVHLYFRTASPNMLGWHMQCTLIRALKHLCAGIVQLFVMLQIIHKLPM